MVEHILELIEIKNHSIYHPSKDKPNNKMKDALTTIAFDLDNGIKIQAAIPTRMLGEKTAPNIEVWKPKLIQILIDDLEYHKKQIEQMIELNKIKQQ
jgi:hypothetical protein